MESDGWFRAPDAQRRNKMSVYKKKSGIVYLGVFLCLICAAATAIMGTVSYLTAKPIKAAKLKKVADGLKIVLPEFDNEPANDIMHIKSSDGQNIKIYTATKDGEVIGYAVEADSSLGYGGNVTGLIGYNPDGSIRTFIITTHNETPGLGTKITDRVRQRTIFDVIKRTPPDPSLPPNSILDQFKGWKSDASETVAWTVKKDGGTVDFVSGATISSKAATDLAWRATHTLSEALAKGDLGTVKNTNGDE